MRKYVHHRETKTHHEGDNQTGMAYLPGDRTPKKRSKLHTSGAYAVLAFLYLDPGEGGDQAQ